MTTFDKREEGFEKQFVHDEALKFKAVARRNRMLGLWAALKLGLSGAQAETYAKEVVMADFEEPGGTTYSEKSAGISTPRASHNRIIRSGVPWTS